MYGSEQEAAWAHDRAVLAALGPTAAPTDLNFPSAAPHLTTQPGSATTSTAAAAGGGGAVGGVGTSSIATSTAMGAGSPWTAAAAAAAVTGTPTSTLTQLQSANTAAAAAAASAATAAAMSAPEYKGVVWDPVSRQFQAQALDGAGSIQLLGLYPTAEEAAAEYDSRLVRSGIHDESKLNFGLANYLHLLPAPVVAAGAGDASMGAAYGAVAAGGGGAFGVSSSGVMLAGGTCSSGMQDPLGAHAAALAAAVDMAAAAAAVEDAAAAAAVAAAAGGGDVVGTAVMSALGTEGAGAELAAAAAPAAPPTGKNKGKAGLKGVAKAGRAKGSRQKNPQSKYKGVSWSVSTQRWAAVIWDR